MAGRGISGHHATVAGTHTWLTPPEILEALGAFDLDPCAAPDPRPWPTARQHIVLPADGLVAPWSGRVWLNPPYGPNVGRWIRKLVLHRHGTALVFARIETSWFTPHIWDAADAVLFIRGRLHFHRPDGARAVENAGGPSVLVAYGQEDASALERSRIPGKFLRLRSIPPRLSVQRMGAG